MALSPNVKYISILCISTLKPISLDICSAAAWCPIADCVSVDSATISFASSMDIVFLVYVPSLGTMQVFNRYNIRFLFFLLMMVQRYGVFLTLPNFLQIFLCFFLFFLC